MTTRPAWDNDGFPQIGWPGFSQEKTDNGVALLLQSDAGELLCIFYYCRQDVPRDTFAGEIGFHVNPFHLRKGIAPRAVGCSSTHTATQELTLPLVAPGGLRPFGEEPWIKADLRANFEGRDATCPRHSFDGLLAHAKHFCDFFDVQSVVKISEPARNAQHLLLRR